MGVEDGELPNVDLEAFPIPLHLIYIGDASAGKDYCAYELHGMIQDLMMQRVLVLRRAEE